MPSMTLVEIKDLPKLLRSQFCSIVHAQSPNIISEWRTAPTTPEVSWKISVLAQKSFQE